MMAVSGAVQYKVQKTGPEEEPECGLVRFKGPQATVQDLVDEMVGRRKAWSDPEILQGKEAGETLTDWGSYAGGKTALAPMIMTESKAPTGDVVNVTNTVVSKIRSCMATDSENGYEKLVGIVRKAYQQRCAMRTGLEERLPDQALKEETTLDHASSFASETSSEANDIRFHLKCMGIKERKWAREIERAGYTDMECLAATDSKALAKELKMPSGITDRFLEGMKDFREKS